MILYLYKLIYYLFWRRRLFIVVNVLLHFCYYPIWCGQLNLLHPRILVPSFVKTVWVVLERFLNIINVFLNFSYIQYNFAIIFTWKRAFYLGNFEFPQPRMFGWNWSSGSGEVEKHVKRLQMHGRTETYRQHTTGNQKSSL